MYLLFVAGIAAVAVMAMSRGGGRSLSDWLEAEVVVRQKLIDDPQAQAAVRISDADMIATLQRRGEQVAPALISVRRIEIPVSGVGGVPGFSITYRLLSVQTIAMDTPLQALGDVIYTVGRDVYGNYQLVETKWPLEWQNDTTDPWSPLPVPMPMPMPGGPVPAYPLEPMPMPERPVPLVPWNPAWGDPDDPW